MSSGTNHTWAFRAIIRKYPNKKLVEILKNLVASTVGNKGKWCAEAIRFPGNPLDSHFHNFYVSMDQLRKWDRRK
jgi:hypothetical protein